MNKIDIKPSIITFDNSQKIKKFIITFLIIVLIILKFLILIISF